MSDLNEAYEAAKLREKELIEIAIQHKEKHEAINDIYLSYKQDVFEQLDTLSKSACKLLTLLKEDHALKFLSEENINEIDLSIIQVLQKLIK